ncbi:thiamine pyrophosphate-dependent enzyme, partial [Actinophytocola sp.]|uniref:thiamine pyrophosphate-dependent enzyme n=1 Tax=Actinophytocola sp. TaxID=1872138 RepID=UPI002D8061C3
NLKILLFNNRIYGLTKGQYSPTSEEGKVTKSTPMGSLDHPFNPISLALGADATFVARTLDNDRAQLTEILTAAAEHRGSAFIEIYQNCPIFNDGAFDILKEPGEKEQRLIPLVHGQPIRFGASGEYGVVRSGFAGLDVAKVSEVGEEALVVHDANIADPTYAFALSRLSTQDLSHTVTGIFRDVSRPTYDDTARTQVETARTRRPGDLQSLLRGSDTWTVAS